MALFADVMGVPCYLLNFQIFLKEWKVCELQAVAMEKEMELNTSVRDLHLI